MIIAYTKNKDTVEVSKHDEHIIASCNDHEGPISVVELYDLLNEAIIIGFKKEKKHD